MYVGLLLYCVWLCDVLEGWCICVEVVVWFGGDVFEFVFECVLEFGVFVEMFELWCVDFVVLLVVICVCGGCLFVDFIGVVGDVVVWCVCLKFNCVIDDEVLYWLNCV